MRSPTGARPDPAGHPAAQRFRVRLDPAHGGRWTSLVDPTGREWLWSRPDDRRATVRPGDAFVDAGGVEECFPTITGIPDHGDVWARAWSDRDGWTTVRTGPFELQRRVRAAEDVVVDYRLTGPPGAAFVWAFHALLAPDPGTRIVAGPARSRTWPAAGPAVEDDWPAIAGRPHGDVLGPDDGTAVFCVLPDLTALTVRSGAARLGFHLESPDAPCSFGIWRNLGGFPASGERYRSFGIEPMLGRGPTPTTTGDAALVPATGELRWRLSIS